MRLKWVFFFFGHNKKLKYFVFGYTLNNGKQLIDLFLFLQN